MKFITLVLLLLLSVNSFAAITNPLKVPVWSDLEKYQSKAIQSVPFLNHEYIAFAGLNYGFKNGVGFDGMACKKLSRYLCGGARIFVGSLNSSAIVRSPTPLESVVVSSDFNSVLTHSENWFAIVPEIGLSVHTQIIPLAEGLWSESAWIGFGKAFIGGRSGWAISFEPGIHKKFIASGNFGWSLKSKYTFGWLNPKDNSPGTIPYDWINLTADIFYVW